MATLTDSINAAGSNVVPTGRAALALARDLAGRAGLDDLAQPTLLDLWFESRMFYRADDGAGNPQVVKALDLMATVSRASTALIPNWSGRSGDPVGTLRQSPANAVRYNAPPNTAPGRLIEAAATNLNRNPRAEGSEPGEIGGAGAWPTYWEMILSGGLTFTILGQVVRDGWPGLLIRVDGTQTSDAAIGFESTTGMTAATATAYTSSFAAALEVGAVPAGASVASVIYERTAAGVSVASGTSAVALDSVLRRYADSRTFSGGGTVARGQNGFVLVRNGADREWNNVEIFLSMPNFVAAASASSPIAPPVGTLAAATRAAETVTEGVNFTRASWATAMAWNGVSGGVVGPIAHFPPDAVRVADGGLWREASGTNKIRNPLAVGGAPGVWPTNWLYGASGGMTATVDDRGEDDFGTYLQVTLSGTASGDARYDFETATYIPGVDGDNRVASFGLRVISGTMPGSPKIGLFEMTSGGATVSSHLSSALTVDRQCRRYWFHEALSGGGTTAYVRPSLYIDNPSGAVACTFRIYYPQVENGIRPTMPMLPPPGTIAEATRATERLYLSVPSLIAATGFTLAVEYSPMLDTTAGYSASTPFIVTLQPASGTAGYAAIYQSGPNGVATIRSGGASIAFGAAQGAMVIGARRRHALAYASNDMAAFADGVTEILDTSGTITETLAQIEIGGVANGSRWHGLLHSVRLAAARLPDANLTALVGN